MFTETAFAMQFPYPLRSVDICWQSCQRTEKLDVSRQLQVEGTQHKLTELPFLNAKQNSGIAWYMPFKSVNINDHFRKISCGFEK